MKHLKRTDQKDASMQAESIYAWFESVCMKQGDKRAVTFLRDGAVETQRSYTQLLADINAFARTLMAHGAEKGKTVVLFLEKSMISVVAHFALQKIGAISVPLNPGFKLSEMAYLLKDSDPVLVVAHEKKTGLFLKIAPDLSILTVSTDVPYDDLDLFSSVTGKTICSLPGAKDPGLIVYTSGTTGNPKGAVLTQANLVHDARNIIDIWQMTDKDVLCHALPLFHIHGLCFALHTTLLAGGHVILLDQFQPEKVLAVLGDKGASACSIFMAVPAMYTKLLNLLEENPVDFSHLRLVTSGSAPLLESEFERIARFFGKPPVEREGMSETGMNFSNPLGGRKRAGSIGQPLPGLQVRIVDPDNFKDRADGDIGEIWLKGPGITQGYWKKPEETRQAFVDGWFRTGDLGRADKDRYYFLTDRIKHIIITGGENVSAKEVESVINRFPGVKESSVVGIFDKTWGEKIAAAVVADASVRPDPGAIRQYCKETLHDWKCPKDILFVDEIPKNTMGKILKQEVKKMFEKNPER